MVVLTDIPVELFLDNILPLLPLPDLMHLSQTNQFFASLSADETFWHRKLQEDYNFSGAETARKSGWQFLYRRLYRPRVYVWGERSNGRLGLNAVPQTIVHGGVPLPVHLQIPGVRIVNLVAGGMSFHALDSRGDIYVWGALDGTSAALRNDGFSERSKIAECPMRLRLPVKFRSISCGRLHSSALDTTSQIWSFKSWGRPFVLSSPLVDRSTADTMPVQVECGWAFTAVLMQSGDVLLFWLFSGSVHDCITAKEEELEQNPSDEKRAKINPGKPNEIPCYHWRMDGVDPVRLPQIPDRQLPVLPQSGLSDEQLNEETKLVKIAGADNTIFGLTNKGHVLKYAMLAGENTYQQGSWEFLDEFSDVTKVKAHPTFRVPDQPSPDGREGPRPPNTMHITHITAQFQTFVAYSIGDRSVVLMGKVFDDGPLPVQGLPEPVRPKIIPELQNQGVISVVLGDYHYGALTADGRLLTWGAFSKGALGLGDPMSLQVGAPGGFATQQHQDDARRRQFMVAPPAEVLVPTEVRFDHGERVSRKRYCFAAAAAGWHMGALVIDLEEGDDDTNDDSLDSMPGAFPEQPGPSSSPPPVIHNPSAIPIIPFGVGGGSNIFRVGFAGRGMGRGRGRGRGMPPGPGGG